jgi:hypothetical protein
MDAATEETGATPKTTSEISETSDASTWSTALTTMSGAIPTPRAFFNYQASHNSFRDTLCKAELWFFTICVCNSAVRMVASWWASRK